MQTSYSLTQMFQDKNGLKIFLSKEVLVSRYYFLFI